MSIKLTPREHDVLRAMSNGASIKQAAEQLKLSVHTIKCYVHAAYKKLGARNGADAVRRWLQLS